MGCVFQVDFYGYDEGDLNAEVTFEGIEPTGGGTLASDTVFIGEDPAGGGTDLDASATYDLSSALAGIDTHGMQGHHVRLTVNADGSQGANVKHKVFWVEGCESPPPPTTTTTTVPETTVPETTAPETTVPETTASTPDTTTPTETTTPDEPDEPDEPGEPGEPGQTGGGAISSPAPAIGGQPNLTG